MTARELAEKVFMELMSVGVRERVKGNTYQEAKISSITSLLQTALDEATNRNAFYVAEKKKWMGEGIRVGEKIAYEDAARIAEMVWSHVSEEEEFEPPSATLTKNEIADRIRLRAKEIQ